MYVVQMIDGLVVGGAQQLLITFAQEADKRGSKLMVISLADEDGSPYPDQLRALGVAVHFFPTKRIFDIKNLYRIFRLFRTEKPDILHTHLTYSNIVGSMIARLLGIPVVSTIHSTRVDPQFHAPRTEWVETFALRFLMKKVIACGPAVAEHYRMTVRDESVLMIPNAVDCSVPDVSSSERDGLRKQIAVNADRPILISVGRLAIQKGFDDLIDAFSIVHASHPMAFLAIVGNGELYDELEEKIKSLDLSNHIRLLGRRADVPHLLAASDMYVLASRWEGLPIAVLEAMTAGLPVLTTDVGDNAWAIGSAGVTVPPNQPEIFAQALAELLDDPARCKALGQAARARIEEKFNPSAWFDKIIAVYQDLLRS